MNSSARDASLTATLAALGFERVDVFRTPPAESTRIGPTLFKSSARRPSMGTLVSLTALDPAPDRMQEAFAEAFLEMDRVVALLNRYDDGSALSHLNARGAMDDAPAELSVVMESALRYHILSRGTFDVTVQPLVDLLRHRGLVDGGSIPASGEGEMGPDAELSDVLQLVDGGAVEISDRSVRLRKSGMGVTLDGIAKGYVVDRMARILSGHGLQHWLIDAGGDIRTAGRREDGAPWRIGVQDPRKEGDLPDVIELSGGAVATSGSYEVYFDRSRTSHHIVSTGSGRSPTLCASASVAAPTAMAADALATTLFIMGPERGIPFIDSLRGCACLVVDADGRQRRSHGWRSTLRESWRTERA